jgi:hypothetical protein
MRVVKFAARFFTLSTLFTLFASATAFAVTTEVWKNQSADDFRAGKLEQVVVSSEGEISLGRRMSRLPVEGERLVWSVVRDGKGNAYVGTYPKGQVLRVQGVTGEGPYKIERVFDIGEAGGAGVTALALDPQGNLYAGTLPKGKIFRLDAATGKAAEYATVPAMYVWALETGDDGKLYAATGPEGKVYTIEPGGRVSLLFDSKQEHILSLARDRSGHLYAGAAPKAILFRIAPDGKATAVHHFEGDEIRAIAVNKDEITVAVNELKGKPATGTLFFGARPPQPAQVTPAPGAPGGPPHGAATPAPAAAAPAPVVAPAPVRPLGEASLYRVSADGRVERLLHMPRGYFTSLGIDQSGNAYAGSGGEGRVYRVTPSRELSIPFDFEEKQTMAVTVQPDGSALVGTGNGAAVYVVTPKQAERGTFYSQVFDARFPSRWGNVAWRGEGTVRVRTRSGNTESPYMSWSDWSENLKDTPAKVQSPTARYLQYRVDFGKDPAAVLREVLVYYLQQNQRARITAIKVGDAPPTSSSPLTIITIGPSRPTPTDSKAPNTLAKGSPSSSPHAAPHAPSAPPKHQPMRKITWTVENPDGDQLIYWVDVKEQGAPNWILLNQREPLTDTSYSWNTESFPDGNYLIRVRLSDERANPPELALTHERVSAPVLVDNRKPELVDVEIDEKLLEVKGTARDSFSVIRRIEYSVDGGDAYLVHPVDGIFDSKEEKFQFRLRERPTVGPHTLTVRAYDSDGNIGTVNLVFRVQ